MILFLGVIWAVGALLLVFLGPLFLASPELAALILQTHTLIIAAGGLIWVGLRWAARGGA